MDAKALAVNLTNATRAFLAGGSKTTPGVTVDWQEYARVRKQGTLGVQYHVFVHGVPAVHRYTLFEWPINVKAPSAAMGGVTLGQNGIVMCSGRPDECGSSDKPDDPIELTYLPAKGEPYRMMLVSEDQKVSVLFGVVPDPLVKINHGCSVEAIRLLPKWEIVLVRAKGLQPNAEVHFSMKSESETQQGDDKADANGEYFTTVLPFVQDKSSGKAEVRVSSGDCSPDVSFEWGKL